MKETWRVDVDVSRFNCERFEFDTWVEAYTFMHELHVYGLMVPQKPNENQEFIHYNPCVIRTSYLTRLKTRGGSTNGNPTT